jgi:zinc protease
VSRAARAVHVLLALLAGALIAGPASAALTQKVLDNGLTVVIKHDAGSDIAGVEVMVRVGQALEGSGKVGLRGVLQEVILRGMQDRIDDPAWASLAEQRDASDQRRLFNASTDWDYVECYGTVTSDRLADCCKFLAATVFDPAITEERRKQVVETVSSLLDEARATGNVQPPPGLREAHALLRKAMSGGRDSGLPLYGTPASLAALSLDDLKGFHARYYVPENMCVAVVSPLSDEEAAAAVAQAFGAQPRSGTAVPPAQPPQALAHGVEVGGSAALHEAFIRDEDVACLMVGVPVPSVPDKEACAADVIYAALGRPGGRLEADEDLKKSLTDVYYLGPVPHGEPPTPMPAFSTSAAPGAEQIDSVRALLSRGNATGAYMAVQAWVDPLRLNDAEAAIIAQLNALADKPLADQELQAAKDSAINAYARAHETKRDVAWLLARPVILGQNASQEETYAQTVEALTAQDIQQMAAKYFREPSIAVVLPLTP